MPGPLPSSEYRRRIARALEQEDPEAEADARVNLASALLAEKDAAAESAFEEARAFVRRQQDRRREYVLSVNFADAFLEWDQPERALQLAKRAVELAGSASQRVRARLTMSRVLATGFGETARGVEALVAALDQLDAFMGRDPDRAEALIRELELPFAESAKLALDAGDTALAARALRVLDPEAAARLPVRTPPAAAASLAVLRGMTDPELDAVLGAWRARRGAAAAPLTGILQQMKELADLHRWASAADRLAWTAGSGASGPQASRNGPAALLHLAAGVADGTIAVEAGRNATATLAIPADDLPAVCLFALATAEHRRGAGAVLRLAAESTDDDALAARLYGILVSYAQARGDHRTAVELCGAGEARLGGGSQAQLLAVLTNERAVSSMRLGDAAGSLEHARLARDRAIAAGDAKLAGGAGVNVANALMGLGRHAEALALLEPLVSELARLGDKYGVDTARFNLAACRLALGDLDGVTFDAGSDDPDEAFMAGRVMAERGDLDGAIGQYERSLARLEAAGRRYDGEARARSDLARLLYEAGRIDAAVAELRAALPLLERQGTRPQLVDANVRLAEMQYRRPAIAEGYAKRAVELARELGDPKEVALATAVLGQVRLLAGRPHEALATLAEAAATDPDGGSSYRFTTAEALTAVGRPAEAMPIYEALLDERDDAGPRLQALLGLGEALRRMNQTARALALFREGHGIAEVSPPSEETFEAYNRLGFALLAAGDASGALDVFEQGIDRARRAGAAASEILMLNNYGSALRDIGDLEGAEATLLRSHAAALDAGIERAEALAIFGLANVSASARRHAEARSRYLEALHVAGQIGDRTMEAACLDSLGTQFSAEREPARAVEYHQRAAALHGELADWEHQVADELNLSQGYLLLDEIGESEAALHRARAVADEHRVMVPEPGFGMAAAQLGAAKGDWPAAETGFRAALASLEQLRRTMTSPAQQRQWAGQRSFAYNLATEAAIHADEPEAAVSFIEWNRTRYLRALADRRAQRPASVEEAVWLRYLRAADRMSEARIQWRSGLAATDQAAKRRLAEAEAEHTHALAEVASGGVAASPEEPLPGPPALDDLVRRLPVGSAAVWLATYNAGLGIVAAGRTAAGSIWARCSMNASFSGADLDGLIHGNREAVIAGLRSNPLDTLDPSSFGWLTAGLEPLRARWWKPMLARVGALLGKQIWPGILALLPDGCRDVLLLPGPGFNVLPLHAARLADGDYVCDRYRVSYAPSLGILRPEDARAALPPQPRLGQASDPTGDLRFSRIEAREVARRFAPGDVTSFSGADATAERVLELLEASDVVHFAGHGYYEPREPLQSRLLCAPDGDDSGALSLARLLDRGGSSRSRFVVLSACETGQVEATDSLNDFLGLPGGLLTFGADAVLATFWRVDDMAACLLLDRFFATWRNERVGPVAALAAAQAWLRDELTAGDLVARIEGWMAAATGGEDKWLRRERNFWRAQEPDARPFAGEDAWAAFHLVGVSGAPGPGN